jgi:hypothetical protein
MFGVSVRLHPTMYAVTHYSLETREDRDRCVREPWVWWYLCDDSDDWEWKRGGAWNQDSGQGPRIDEAHGGSALPASPVEQIERDLEDMPYPGTAGVTGEEDEDEGDRW